MNLTVEQLQYTGEAIGGGYGYLWFDNPREGIKQLFMGKGDTELLPFHF